MSYNAHQIMLENERKLKAWELQYCQREDLAAPIVYKGYVTGLTHHAYARMSHLLKPGDKLYVRADPDNKYDTNATGLFFRRSDTAEAEPVQIGWIPKTLNRVAAQAIREGYRLLATINAHNPTTSNPTTMLMCTVVIVSQLPQKGNPPAVLTQEIHMSKLATVVQKNIDLGTSAAFLEAGRIANNQLSSIASKKLPIMVRAYADTALGRLLLANVALMARDHFRPDDERLGKLVNAMTVSAYQEVLQNFDVEQMIDDLVSNSTIKKALKSIDSASAAEAG